LAGTPVSKQDERAVLVAAPVDFFEVEDLGVEVHRSLEVRDPNADIAEP